ITDPVVQNWFSLLAPQSMPTPIANFGGIGCCANPPDTNGDIGPNHYIQTINARFAIFNRQGSVLYGPAAINTLWIGFGGLCETNNQGDPIAIYDSIADRWLISQFASNDDGNGHPAPPYLQCIAVSST